MSPVNDAPVAVDDSFLTGQNLTRTGASVLVNDTDIDGNPLTAALVTQALHGVAVVNADGTFTYTPNLNYHGPDSFTYRANDGTADSNVATVQIEVNASPVGVKEQYSVAEGGTLSVSAAAGVLRNDTDIDSTALSAVLVRNVGHGSLTLNADGSFNYVPLAGYSGSDSYTYRPTDGLTFGKTTTVSLFIEPVADAIPAVVLASTVVLAAGELPVLATFNDFNNGSAGGWVAHDTVTDSPGVIEINPESIYGGPSTTNQVLDVESTAGINSLQQSFATHNGAVYQLDVDYSARAAAGGGGDNSTLQVLVNGTVIGVMPGGEGFGYTHHTFSFAGTGGSDLVEFRALDGHVDAVGGLIDNLGVKQTASAYQDHAAFLPSITGIFGDVGAAGEHHVIRLSGMPVGTSVTDGSTAHTFVTTAVGQAVEIFNADHGISSNWNLDAISVTGPAGYVGPLHLMATESTNSGSVVTATHDFALNYSATSFSGNGQANIIHGTTVNDIISGGPGDDILSGSLGINTFAYKSGDLAAGTGGDHILDFKVASGASAGDVLDISDLLSGSGITHTAFSGHEANFLQVTATGSSGIAIQFDATGSGGAGAAPAVPLATLDGVGPGVTLNSLLEHGQVHGV